MNKIRLIKNIFVSLAALLSVSCTSELDEQATHVALREGEVSLQWLAPNMGIKHVKSRASDPKTAAEQQINNVHVFIFDPEGNYLEADNNDAFQGYRYIEGNPNLVLETTMFASQDDASLATIIAVANVPNETFGETNAQGNPNSINNRSDLESFVYNLNGFTATLPETGLPMVGRLDNQDLSSDAENKVILIQMESLMARIDLNFTMDPYQSSDDGRNPSLLFDKVSVGNFPMGGTITPQLDTKNVTDNTEITLQPKTEVSVTDFTGRTIREGEPQELTLYMFEHARAAKKDITYPEGIDDDEKQRYKNSWAHDEAAYITLEGTYTNHNGYAYAVTYTLYPGANAENDFTIKANCQYKNNITVKGITVNNLGDEALLDTRVNIDSEDNPYFIEMLREREFDAHFNVTPMDVYIYKGGSVKVEILNSDEVDWIRMEPIKEAATEAGYKKRKYFTTDLVTNTLAENITYTVTQQEERIYFYVDENVPQNGHRDGEDVEAREATLKITYIDPNGNEDPPREVILRQAGMRAVYFDKFASGQWIETCMPFYFYIEEYEEYLEHYDGKNTYNDTYEGFKWGLNGLESGLGVQNGRPYNQYMKWGWLNTMQIMYRYQHNPQLYRGYEMTLNDTPDSAAEYCYNKNKRDEDGNVVEARWYLPTISELEYALEKYYGIFDVFQDKWYWSSNPGAEGNNGDNGENPDYARGTRIKYEPTNTEANDDGFVHYMSNPDWPYDYVNSSNPIKRGEGGHALRDEEFRIRAAYIYQVPNDAPGVIVSSDKEPITNLRN